MINTPVSNAAYQLFITGFFLLQSITHHAEFRRNSRQADESENNKTRPTKVLVGIITAIFIILRTPAFNFQPPTGVFASVNQTSEHFPSPGRPSAIERKCHVSSALLFDSELFASILPTVSLLVIFAIFYPWAKHL